MSFILSLIIFSGGLFARSNDKNFITVTFLKTGNSDCIIIKTIDAAVMIDTALEESFETIDGKLKSMGIKELDYLIITHYDIDHIGSASQIINKYTPKEIYCTYNRPKIHSDSHKKYVDIVETLKITPNIVRKEKTIKLGKAVLKIIPPKSDFYLFDCSNNSSLLVSLFFGSSSFLFTGDIEKERISEVLNEGIAKYDVLKVPHHGWVEDNTADLIKAVSPRYSVITNSSGYRKIPATLAALISNGSYFYTTTNGDVTFKCYENYVAVSQNYLSR